MNIPFKYIWSLQHVHVRNLAEETRENEQDRLDDIALDEQLDQAAEHEAIGGNFEED